MEEELQIWFRRFIELYSCYSFYFTFVFSAKKGVIFVNIFCILLVQVVQQRWNNTDDTWAGKTIDGNSGAEWSLHTPHDLRLPRF